MHRFFVDSQAIKRGRVTLSPDTAHQITRVLRMRIGERFLVLDDSGTEYTAELLRMPAGKERGPAVAKIVSKREATSEPRTAITLYQALLKGERFEWVLQKGTELGIMRFVPLLSARVVARAGGGTGKKQERWRSIIREAAEQSGRGRLPVLEKPMAFAEACAEVRDSGVAGLLACEGIEGLGLKQAMAGFLDEDRRSLAQIGLFIGPEGGFTVDEVALARQHKLRAFGLGPRILRSETAGLVAASAVLYELGDLGG